MPATSKSQQRLMGWVHAVQKGEAKHAPAKIRRIAKTISKTDAKHFAATKHRRLPEKKGSVGSCVKCGHDLYWAPAIGEEYLHPHCMCCGFTDLTRNGQVKSASTPGIPARLLREYVPLGERREHLNPDEEKALSSGKSQWFPPILKTDATPIPSMMASPAKHGLLKALLYGGAGALGGGALASYMGQPPGVGAAIGGGALGTLGGVTGYVGQHHENADLEERMRRMPPGSTKRDLDNEQMTSDALTARYKPANDLNIGGGLGTGLGAALMRAGPNGFFKSAVAAACGTCGTPKRGAWCPQCRTFGKAVVKVDKLEDSSNDKSATTYCSLCKDPWPCGVKSHVEAVNGKKKEAASKTPFADGFLSRCLHDGMTLPQIGEAVIKLAAVLDDETVDELLDGLEKLSGDLLRAGKEAIKPMVEGAKDVAHAGAGLGHNALELSHGAMNEALEGKSLFKPKVPVRTLPTPQPIASRLAGGGVDLPHEVKPTVPPSSGAAMSPAEVDYHDRMQATQKPLPQQSALPEAELGQKPVRPAVPPEPAQQRAPAAGGADVSDPIGAGTPKPTVQPPAMPPGVSMRPKSFWNDTQQNLERFTRYPGRALQTGIGMLVGGMTAGSTTNDWDWNDPEKWNQNGSHSVRPWLQGAGAIAGGLLGNNFTRAKLLATTAGGRGWLNKAREFGTQPAGRMMAGMTAGGMTGLVADKLDPHATQGHGTGYGALAGLGVGALANAPGLRGTINEAGHEVGGLGEKMHNVASGLTTSVPMFGAGEYLDMAASRVAKTPGLKNIPGVQGAADYMHEATGNPGNSKLRTWARILGGGALAATLAGVPGTSDYFDATHPDQRGTGGNNDQKMDVIHRSMMNVGTEPTNGVVPTPDQTEANRQMVWEHMKGQPLNNVVTAINGNMPQETAQTTPWQAATSFAKDPGGYMIQRALANPETLQKIQKQISPAMAKFSESPEFHNMLENTFKKELGMSMGEAKQMLAKAKSGTDMMGSLSNMLGFMDPLLQMIGVDGKSMGIGTKLILLLGGLGLIGGGLSSLFGGGGGSMAAMLGGGAAAGAALSPQFGGPNLFNMFSGKGAAPAAH